MKSEIFFESGITFMVNSIFFAFGIMILFGVILIINNLLHRYWRPIKLIRYEVHEIVDQDLKQ